MLQNLGCNAGVKIGRLKIPIYYALFQLRKFSEGATQVVVSSHNWPVLVCVIVSNLICM